MPAAIDYFERAIARDPSFALACANLGACVHRVGRDRRDGARRRRIAARRVRRDRSAARSTRSSARRTARWRYLKMVRDFDWAGAEAEFKRALELNPSGADAYDLYGRLCSALGALRRRDALSRARRSSIRSRTASTSRRCCSAPAATTRRSRARDRDGPRPVRAARRPLSAGRSSSAVNRRGDLARLRKAVALGEHALGSRSSARRSALRAARTKRATSSAARGAVASVVRLAVHVRVRLHWARRGRSRDRLVRARRGRAHRRGVRDQGIVSVRAAPNVSAISGVAARDAPRVGSFIRGVAIKARTHVTLSAHQFSQ